VQDVGSVDQLANILWQKNLPENIVLEGTGKKIAREYRYWAFWASKVAREYYELYQQHGIF